MSEQLQPRDLSCFNNLRKGFTKELSDLCEWNKLLLGQFLYTNMGQKKEDSSRPVLYTWLVSME